jgi:uncharacterized protein (DUF1778 family)
VQPGTGQLNLTGHTPTIDLGAVADREGVSVADAIALGDATLTGKTRTDFVREAARHAVEEALLDRAVFAVSPETYAAFLARLDEAPKPNERLRRTMQSPAPWD